MFTLTGGLFCLVLISGTLKGENINVQETDGILASNAPKPEDLPQQSSASVRQPQMNKAVMGPSSKTELTSTIINESFLPNNASNPKSASDGPVILQKNTTYRFQIERSPQPDSQQPQYRADPPQQYSAQYPIQYPQYSYPYSPYAYNPAVPQYPAQAQYPSGQYPYMQPYPYAQPAAPAAQPSSPQTEEDPVVKSPLGSLVTAFNELLNFVEKADNVAPKLSLNLDKYLVDENITATNAPNQVLGRELGVGLTAKPEKKASQRHKHKSHQHEDSEEGVGKSIEKLLPHLHKQCFYSFDGDLNGQFLDWPAPPPVIPYYLFLPYSQKKRRHHKHEN